MQPARNQVGGHVCTSLPGRVQGNTLGSCDKPGVPLMSRRDGQTAAQSTFALVENTGWKYVMVMMM
jgi:hypothetical protein